MEYAIHTDAELLAMTQAELVEQFRGLVCKIAKYYGDHAVGKAGLDQNDLIQAGFIGILAARRTFKEGTGATLKTHINNCVRWYAGNEFRKMSRFLKVSPHASYKTDDPEKLGFLLRADWAPASINNEKSNKRQLTQSSNCLAYTDERPEDVETHEDLYHHLDMLPLRLQDVLRMRYGLAGNNIHTLAEVGVKLGITRERARQLQLKAEQRLRMLMEEACTTSDLKS